MFRILDSPSVYTDGPYFHDNFSRPTGVFDCDVDDPVCGEGLGFENRLSPATGLPVSQRHFSRLHLIKIYQPRQK